MLVGQVLGYYWQIQNVENFIDQAGKGVFGLWNWKHIAKVYGIIAFTFIY